MFLVELSAGLAAESMALQADALDFIGDTATYALSLWVIGRPLRVRAGAALAKGLSLGALGLWVIGATCYRLVVLGEPEPLVMGGIGLLALTANAAAAVLLLRFRDGDSNVRSVWLCSRNDAIGNLAVVAAALAVGGTGTPWPAPVPELRAPHRPAGRRRAALRAQRRPGPRGLRPAAGRSPLHGEAPGMNIRRKQQEGPAP